MEILFKDQAPLTPAIWEELVETATRMMEAQTTARKVMHCEEPRGARYTSVQTGGLNKLPAVKNYPGIKTSANIVQPLIESRIEFELDLDELLSIERGNKAANLDNLEDAVKQMILFEENCVYNGYKEGNIPGLIPSMSTPKVATDGSSQSIIDAILKAAIIMKDMGVEGPYQLVAGPDFITKTSQLVSNKPLAALIEEELKTEIELSPAVKGALLFPFNSEDNNFVIGRDLSIAFQSMDKNKVRFFLLESFTFTNTNDKAAVQLNL
ncbi:family 1 encapsulin nanocompartment shell protein [Porphyromonas pogonae]|uniref:family 1 encapsulin nanocompartment shell protein n=1 Tax=Porphyromonas pogonae TaxID=867595 RepID=UPI002E76E69A|nr:family 1 encapsulin nanocompartment shell protein [Porphyromonas pogonae]